MEMALIRLFRDWEPFYANNTEYYLPAMARTHVYNRDYVYGSTRYVHSFNALHFSREFSKVSQKLVKPGLI
jgi:hypothetical protein